jgi:hypothetical protein
MVYETILYEVSDDGVTIAHNRAGRLNAFALEMGQEPRRGFCSAPCRRNRWAVSEG